MPGKNEPLHAPLTPDHSVIIYWKNLKENDVFFRYFPKKDKKKSSIKKEQKENPFKILKNLNLG